MKNQEKANTIFSITAPVSGKVVPLSQVPDPVFSEKVLGDGVAVIPTEGKIFSPVTGEVVSVAATRHAYGFSSENGVEVLVHFGLETVANLKPTVVKVPITPVVFYYRTIAGYTVIILAILWLPAS